MDGTLLKAAELWPYKPRNACFPDEDGSLIYLAGAGEMTGTKLCCMGFLLHWATAIPPNSLHSKALVKENNFGDNALFLSTPTQHCIPFCRRKTDLVMRCHF